jgi:hypothetical protein
MVFSRVREWRFEKVLCFCTVIFGLDQTHFLIDSIFSLSQGRWTDYAVSMRELNVQWAFHSRQQQ